VHRSRVMLLCSALLAGVTIAAPAAPATADEFNGCNSVSGCLPDNFDHTYCWGSSFTASDLRSAANYGMGNLDSQTSYFDTFIGTCGSVTDLIWHTMSSSTTRGDYLCLAKNSANECEQARVRLNPTLLTNTLNREKTACHEIGHSGGLAHSDTASDCMVNGAVTSGHRTYNDHHRAHLNNRS